MGDRLTGEEAQTAPKGYGDIFDALFPHYLAMGMPAEEYWDGESWLKTAYRNAYRIRIENEQRMADRNNWYMGQYLIKVLQAVPLLVAGLNVKSTSNLPDYPDMPFLEKIEMEKKEEARKKYEEDQSKMAMAMFQAMITKFNKNVQKRLEREQAGGTGQ